MIERLERCLALSLAIVISTLFAFNLPSVQAQTPNVGLNLPDQNFVGEQFCFAAEVTNAGSTGYGPYLRLALPPEITLNSATFLNLGVTTTTVGVFPAAPGNQLTDPVIDQAVTGTPGHTLIILELPIGSVVTGAPPLVVEMCATISTTATVGVPLPVTATSVYEFGNTPTGANGPIVGAPLTDTITPTLYLFEKTNTAPEGERPPGPTWQYDYVLSVDVANGQTLTGLVFGDTLPNTVQYVGPVSITGGPGCAVTGQPSTTTPGGSVTVTCASVTGVVGGPEVAVRFPVYILDILNEATCGRQTIINPASFSASYLGAPQPGSTSQSPVEVEHLSLQKSANPAQSIPGTTITYTLNAQVTDYGTDAGLIVVDTLPDGVTFAAHQSLTVGGSGYAITPTVAGNPNGSQTITYDIGAVAGDIAAGTAVTLRYTATIDQYYLNGTPVHANDSLPNTVTATYGLTAGAAGCTEGSGAAVDIVPPQISKTIVNPPPYMFMPGDVVTFRLQMNIPSGDTRAIYFEDFFPLPVFDVSTVSTVFGTDIRFAPSSTFLTPPTAISVNAAQNSLRIDWADLSSESPPQSIAVDVDIAINDEPFADDLYLTNLFQAGYSNTPGASFTADVGIFLHVRAPDLALTKGVSATSGTGTISPPPAALPVNGNLAGADGADQVTYVLTVENRGGAPAYDVTVIDPAPAGLTGCAVSGIRNGAGTALAYTGDLFGAGLVLTDPLAANDGSPAGGGAPYSTDTALITVQCTLGVTVEPRAVIRNTASVTWASLSGATDFPTRTDDATVTIASPAMTKTIVSTNQAHTTGNTVVVGEQVTYQLVITVPEGTSSNVTLTDTLDAGLAFVSANSLTPSPGLTTSVSGGFPAVLSGAAFSASGTGAANQGRVMTLNLGTVTNSNNSPATPETITIEYTAVVINSTTTNAGGQVNNAAVWRWGTNNSINASAPNVTIREPGATVNKTASPITGDAGDTITFSIVVSQAGANNPNAYNVSLTDTVPAGLTLVPGSLATGACVGHTPTSLTATAPNLTATWDAFASPGSCTLTYQATLDPGVQPNQAITNTARATWTSLPGDVTSPQSTHNALSCERTGNTAGCGGTANDYVTTDPATVTVFPLAITKSIASVSINGSDAHNAARPDYTIGEQITYQFTVTIPEGQTTATVFDQLPTGSSVLQVISSRVTAVGANLSGPGLPAVNTAGAASDTNADTILDRVTWSLGALTNTADGVSDAKDQIAFEVVALVVDVAANADGDAPVNTAQVNYGTSSLTATATADVVEPALNITKTADPARGDAGDIITFRLRVEHTAASTADAFAVVLTDVVPVNLAYTAASFPLRAVAGACATAPTALDASDPAGAGLAITWDTLPQGSSCEVEFQALIQQTAPTGTILTNTAALDWSSLAAGGRDYQDSATAQVQVDQNALEKLIVAPLDGDVTIGEQITYEFTGTFAEGLTENAVVTDQLPLAANGAAFEVISSQITFVGGNLTAVPALPAVGAAGAASDTDGVNGNDRVTWTLGDITNAPDGVADANDTIVFQVVARVVDAPANVGLLTGQDTNVLNTATVQHTGGTISGTAGIDLVEPQLSLSKANDVTGPLDAGDTLNVTIAVSHTAQSLAGAYQIALVDTLPAPGMTWAGDATVGGTCGAAVDSTGAPAIKFTFATLPLGSTCTVTYQVTVSDTVAPNSLYANSVTGSYNSLADGTGRASATNTAASSFSTAAPTIAKVVSDTSLPETGSAAHEAANVDLAIGETVTYTVTVTLPEGQTGSVVITDVVPATAEGVIVLQSASITAQGANLTPNLVGRLGALSDALLADGLYDTATFTLGVITNTPDNVADADDTLTLTLVGVLRDLPANADGDVLTNTATLSYATGPDQRATASVDVVEPALALEKTFLVDAASPGDTVEIQVVLTNTGTGPAYGVVVEDVLDAALWDVTTPADVAAPAGFSFSNSPAGTVRYTGGAVLPGAANAVTLVFEATLLTTLTPAQSPISNTATIITAGSAPTEGRDASGAAGSDTLDLLFPDLSLDKTATGTGSFTPGSVLVYDLVIDNVGAGPSGPITVTETVPANTTFSAAGSAPTVWTCADGSPAGTVCTTTLAALAPADAAVTVQFAVRVNTPFPAGVTQIANSAQVADDGSRGADTDLTNNEDTATVSVASATAITATKTDVLAVDVNSDGLANPGDTLRYTVVITNSGDQDAAEVTFADTPDANTALVAGSVTTTQGTVTTGNTAGDASVAVSVGTIPGAGGSVTITFDVVVNNPLPAGVVEVANQGVVAGDNVIETPTDDPDTTDPDDPTVTPVTAAPDVTLTKADALVVDVNSDGLVNPGDTLRYTVVITNSGDQDAAGVTFADTPDANTALVAGSVTTTQGTVTTGNTAGDASVAVSIGTIPGAGGSVTITFDVVVNNPLPAGVVEVANQGVVTGDNVTETPTDDPDTTDPDDPTVTPVTAAPDVSLTKADALVVDANADGVANPGDVIEYTLVLRNAGDRGAAAVTFADTPDANTALVVGSVTTTQGTVTTGNTAGDASVAVSIGDVPGAGGSVTITFRVTVNPSLPTDVVQVANQGLAQGSDIPDTPTDDPDTTDPDDPTITPVDGAPEITATKADALAIDVNGDGVANPGDTLEYTVVITNSGDRDAAGVIFTDTPGANTALVVGSVTASPGTVTTGNTAGDASVAVSVGTIPGAGGGATITFRVTINAPLVPPTTIQVENQGVVTGGNFEDEPTDDPATALPGDPTITPLILAPIVAAQKTDILWNDVNANGAADPGDTLQYTVLITNEGAVNATGVIFSDTPGANTALVAGSIAASQGTVVTGNAAGDARVEVNAGTIPVAGSVTITFQVTVDDPLVPETTTQVANQGIVRGDDFRDVPTDDPDTPAVNDPTVTPLAGSTVLRAEKVDSLAVDVGGDGAASPGDTLEYAITITNTGAADALTVTLTDAPDANTTLVIGSVLTSGTVVSGNTAGDTSVVVNFGTLAPGEVVSAVFRVTINTPLVPAGTRVVSNQGLVISDNVTDTPTDDPDTPAAGDPTDTPIGAPVEAPGLVATKTDRLFDDSPSGDGVPSAGDVLQYTVIITNPGPDAIEDVVFADTPGANTALIAGSVTTTQGVIPEGNTAGDSAVRVSIGAIPAGVSVTVNFRVTINNPVPDGVTFVANQGVVTAPSVPETPTDDPDTPAVDDPTVTPLGAIPWIEAYKSAALTGDVDGDGAANPGDTLTYTVTLANTGYADAVDVVFIDTLPSSLQLVIGSVTVSDPTALTTQDTALTVRIASIAPGTPVVITFEARINPALDRSVTSVPNQGVVSGANFPEEPTDDPETPADDDATIVPVEHGPEIVGPQIVYFDPALSKIGVLEDNALGLPGERLTWILTISNVGTGPGIDVRIVDNVPGELRIDSVTFAGGTYAIEGQTVIFTLTRLDPGQSLTASIQTTVMTSPVDGTLLNVAELNGAGADGVVRTVAASAEVQVVSKLPSTGYPPAERSRSTAPWPALVGAASALGAGAARKRLRRRA